MTCLEINEGLGKALFFMETEGIKITASRCDKMFPIRIIIFSSYLNIHLQSFLPKPGLSIAKSWAVIPKTGWPPAKR